MICTMNDKWKYAFRETFINMPIVLHIMVFVVYANLTLVFGAFLYKDLFCFDSILNGLVGYVFCYMLMIRSRLKDYIRIQDARAWHDLIDEHFRLEKKRKKEDERVRIGDNYINSIDDLYDD